MSSIMPMTPVEDFARRIRALRSSRGISQAELARAAGLSRGYLSRVEIGMQSPTLEVIERLAAALKVRPADLLEDKPRRRAGKKRET
jgi:transcriptional regulator with XRE-family HTH domain